ncbi:MAG TPA: GNAT family N-acetyltransferase [Candidatus Methylomirabilis sp.]|nr:GNAT family N-acetyltransferase [Candidatus Methylomirabilis sp.]HSC70586.1 GNAT family N-acetyltransferase [Candidatus Methylomirabilis sp.]
MAGILHPYEAVTPDPPSGALIEFRDHCSPAFLASLTADAGLGAFTHYAPAAADRQFAALVKVASLPHSRVLVAVCGQSILAYLTFHLPETESRWAAFPTGQVLELGGIEVTRAARGRGLAHRLMTQAFASPDFRTRIVYAQALTWCWDLKGTQMTKAEYRQVILQLFSAYGFETYATDEANIRHDRSNLLLVRVGSDVPGALLREFRATLIQKREEW